MPSRTTTRRSSARTADALQERINKRWGAGTMRFASDPIFRIERIPCGILTIDDVLGGGFARNRYVELFGNYSVGKTYIALRLIANAQSMGFKAAYIDTEKSFDPVFAKETGVKLKRLALHQQDYEGGGNRCVDFMEVLLRSGEYDVIVLDSIAALMPLDEASKPMEGSFMGTEQAKLMSRALRRLTTANKNTAVVFINQTREAIGVMFGKRDIPSGGKALGFYAGTRLDLVRTENIKKKVVAIDHKTSDAKETTVITGHRVLVRVEKDKTGGAKQHDSTTFVFDYGQKGIDQIEDLIYLGRKYGPVCKQGTKWWVRGYEDEPQEGRGKFKSWLRRNAAVQEDLLEMIVNRERTEEEQDEDDS